MRPRATACGFFPSFGFSNGVPFRCSPTALSTTLRATVTKSRSLLERLGMSKPYFRLLRVSITLTDYFRTWLNTHNFDPKAVKHKFKLTHYRKMRCPRMRGPVVARPSWPLGGARDNSAVRPSSRINCGEKNPQLHLPFNRQSLNHPFAQCPGSDGSSVS